MRRDPDDEDGNIDSSDNNDGSPFQPCHSAPVFSNKRDSVDYNLHKKLDFKDPEKQDEEEDGDSV